MHTHKNSFLAPAIAVLIIGSSVALAQTESGSQFRATGIMNGNQVRTVFGNWGVIGQPGEQGRRGAWQNDNDGYIGDVTPLVGAEVKTNGLVFHSVVTCPTSRPTQRRDEDPQSNKAWTFEPVGGYFNANQEKVALSSDPNSYPLFWPDRLGDLTDPGWRGSWNGYFGKRISADLETYYVMDDNNDERFNKAANNTFGVAFRPDITKPNRNGLGLVMSVRGLQWAQFLAKDNIFWLYEITNTGTATYDRVAFGMLVGTYVGVTSTEDYKEYSDDWSFYDAGTNITYTGDYGRTMANPLWVGPVGMVGYAFLESPGNPFDGIDNDEDADSSAIGRSAPEFTQASFDSVLLTAGKQIVLIDNDYSRRLFTIPNRDSVRVWTRGYTDSVWIYPGKTKVVEGNILKDFQANEFINPNAYDGVDNNFNGLIDENYFVHYRQIKRTRTVPPVTLIDVLRPLRHVDYVTGQGTNAFSMIDERRNDLVDNNRNWNVNFDDLGRDGISGTGDFGEGDGLPTSGYNNLGGDTGLPGEPHIDKTDVNESDQIGLTSFFYFAPAGQITLADDEELWKDLRPGFFDVPPSIVNNKPQAGEDGDFVYGSGYFPLLAKATERFSLALVYGGGKGGSVDDDVADLLKNKKTVQKIYDANYQFPQPPDKPTLVAVPGDKQITLYWDRKAEASVDPVLLIKDFEGYKIYKSTDPNFSDIFTITDGSGSRQGYRPLAQFDVKDGVQGYFRSTGELYQGSSGFAYYMGSDNGIVHSFVDNEVENGRRYYYAVVAYDKGDDFIGIFPSENTKFISILPSGQIIRDINTAVVTPNAKTAGYVGPANGVSLTHRTRFGTGEAFYQVLDASRITGHTYRVEFLDSQNDSVDNNKNGLIDAADSSEWTRTTSFYSVRDLQEVTEDFVAQDTSIVRFARKNLIPSTIVVRNQQGATVAASNYILDPVRGTIRGASAGSLPGGQYKITFQYYPVYHSPNIQGTPYLVESKDTDIFDGVQLAFTNFWSAEKIDSSSGYAGKRAYDYSFSPTDLFIGTLSGYKKPSDYEIQFSTKGADTSQANPDLLLEAVATPVNFRIFNVTDNTYIKFYFYDLGVNGGGRLSPGDQVIFLELGPNGKYSPTWTMFFTAKLGDKPDSIINLTTGDKLVLKTKKPFRKEDILEFTTVPPKVDAPKAQQDLSRIRAVPNPYVTASAFESPLNPGVTSGRGQRKVDFIHLPPQSVIHIFTSRGEHVATLRHEGNIEDGTVSWDLKSRENLDVAYGVYFYVVESPAGNKTGKLAIIK